jgi:hypothetical protein
LNQIKVLKFLLNSFQIQSSELVLIFHSKSVELWTKCQQTKLLQMSYSISIKIYIFLTPLTISFDIFLIMCVWKMDKENPNLFSWIGPTCRPWSGAATPTPVVAPPSLPQSPPAWQAHAPGDSFLIGPPSRHIAQPTPGLDCRACPIFRPLAEPAGASFLGSISPLRPDEPDKTRHAHPVIACLDCRSLTPTKLPIGQVKWQGINPEVHIRLVKPRPPSLVASNTNSPLEPPVLPPLRCLVFVATADRRRKACKRHCRC